MACETKSRDIDGHRVVVTQMPASQALDLQSRLAPVLVNALAPLLTSLGRVMGGGQVPEAEEREIVSRAISALTQTLTPEELARIVRELCEEASLDGEKVDFERDFSGGKGIMLMYRVAWFVLEANFADFFAELLPAGVMDRAMKLYRAKTTGNPEASTGGSGAPASPSPLSAA